MDEEKSWTDCDTCHGGGRVTECRFHGGGNCPCAEEWACEECDGEGRLEVEDE